MNFDTLLPAVTFSVAGNISILGGNTIPSMVTGRGDMVTEVSAMVTFRLAHGNRRMEEGNISELRPFGRERHQ